MTTCILLCHTSHDTILHTLLMGDRLPQPVVEDDPCPPSPCSPAQHPATRLTLPKKSRHRYSNMTNGIWHVKEHCFREIYPLRSQVILPTLRNTSKQMEDCRFPWSMPCWQGQANWSRSSRTANEFSAHLSPWHTTSPFPKLVPSLVVGR